MTYNSTEILSTPHREIHELSVDEKKKIPSNVHSQLSKDFVSAARGIAHAGLDLVHNCQVLQKSFDHYMDILGSFVNSSKKAFSKAKEHSDELGALKTKCSQVLDKHKTCIRELSGLVAKINEFTTDEKDKLKGMLNKFQKDEKRVKKQVKKGVKSISDFESFIDESARKFLHEQELSYNFILEKHKAWFETYLHLIPNDFEKTLCKTGMKISDNETEHGDVTDEAKSSSTDDNDSVLTINVAMNDPTRTYDIANICSETRTMQQQETVTGMDAVSSTETRSPSFNDASTQINRDTLTPCTVASPVSQDSSVELSPLTSSKAKSTQAIPDKCEKAEWVNNATSLLPRLVTTHPLEDYHSDKFFMDPTEYRTVDHGTRLRNGRRPPVGGRMVLPPLQNNTPHCYVESMYDSKATASHLQVSQNTRDVIESEWE